MLSYFEKRAVTTGVVNMLERALIKHNDSRFDKILLPKVIIKAKAQQRLDDEAKSELIRVSTELIGNPNEVEHWQDDTLNERQKSQLLEARHILRTWLVIRIIENVFNKAADIAYPDRAHFWKRYVDYLLEINDERRPFLRVLSTSSLKGVLNEDERQRFFRQLYLGRQNTAILMKFGKYTIIELLEGGCAYITTDNHVWTKSVYDIEGLKSPLAVQLLKNDILYSGINNIPDNCKIAHRGDWQMYFRRYLLGKGIIVDKLTGQSRLF